MLHCPKQIDEASPKAVDGPSHHDVELPATSVLEHGIETGTLLAVLAATDTVVVIDIYNVPTTALCNLAERKQLVVGGLIVSGNASVDSGALHDAAPIRLSRGGDAAGC